MKRAFAHAATGVVLAAFLVPVTAGQTSAYCLFGGSTKWPTTSVAATGHVGWNPTTKSNINSSVQAWNGVTPSPLKYGTVTWLSSAVPGQTQGLVIARARFRGDNDAPGMASGALTAVGY